MDVDKRRSVKKAFIQFALIIILQYGGFMIGVLIT